MNNQIEFDELEVLRVQVANLLQRVGELESEKSRLHAMLTVQVRKQAERENSTQSGESLPDNQ